MSIHLASRIASFNIDLGLIQSTRHLNEVVRVHKVSALNGIFRNEARAVSSSCAVRDLEDDLS